MTSRIDCPFISFSMPSLAHQFATEFANAVTAFSSYKYDWVARRGVYSIHNLVFALDPKVSFMKSAVWPSGVS